MFDLNLDLLEKIISTPGVSGDESRVVELLESLAKPYADEIIKDTNGNLILFKRGNSKERKKVMVTSHTDEIGLIVKHIEKGGFVKFLPVGGIDTRTIIAQEFDILGKDGNVRGIIGTKAIHIQKEEERKCATKIEDCFIDTGLTEEDVRSKVCIGDMIVRVAPVRRIGNTICTKSLDNRISVYVALTVLMELKNNPHDIYIALCSQEEVGLRGSRVATNYIKPDIGINLDIGLANDTPGVSESEYESKMGLGPSIKFMDATSICHRGLVRHMSKIASEHNIPHQHEVCNKGGTDTASMQYITGHGCIAGAISIPIRYAHSPVEMVHVDDVKNSSLLLLHLLSSHFDI